MITLKNIVEDITLINEKKGDIGVGFDISGSTQGQILEKEKHIMLELSKTEFFSKRKQHIYPFDNIVDPPFELNAFTKSRLTKLEARGSTSTHLVIQEMLKNPNITTIIVITDGATDSTEIQLRSLMEEMKKKSINFKIITVSLSLEDMSIYDKEQLWIKGVAGIQFVKLCGNSVDEWQIYNGFHKDVPHTLSKSTKVDKRNITFINRLVPKGLSMVGFIHLLLDEIEKNNGNIEFDEDMYGELLMETGRILSIHHIDLQSVYNIEPITIRFLALGHSKFGDIINKDFVKDMIEQGFNLTKKNEPVMKKSDKELPKQKLTSEERKIEFKLADEHLRSKGTVPSTCLNTIGLDLNSYLTVFNEGALFEGDIKRGIDIDERYMSWPNSTDKIHKMLYLPVLDKIFIPSNEENKEQKQLRIINQAIRQTFREPSVTKFPNSIKSPLVPLFLLNRMVKLFVDGIDKETKTMKSLQKLAITQLLMNIYNGNEYVSTFYQEFQKGEIPPMNAAFSGKTTHVSLYNEPLVNCLNLEPSLWWITMMTFAGLFEEQKKHSINILEQLDISVETELLEYLRKTYGKKVPEEFLKEVIVSVPPMSITTFNFLNSTDKTFKLKNHGNCTSGMICTEEEKEDMKARFCFTCRQPVFEATFEPYQVPDNNVIVQEEIKKYRKVDIMSEQKQEHVEVLQQGLPQSLPQGLPQVVLPQGLPQVVLPQGLPQVLPTYAIFLIGAVGAGKTTCRYKMITFFESQGWIVQPISSDDWKKQRLDDKRNIQKQLIEFDKTAHPKKLVIFDLCNHNGIQKEMFKHSIHKYKSIGFMPNYYGEHFMDYASFCLENVLNRPNKFTKETPYYLTPIDAGVKVCIDVLNGRCQGIVASQHIKEPFVPFNTNLPIVEIKSVIKDGAERYRQYLLTKSIDKDIAKIYSEF